MGTIYITRKERLNVSRTVRISERLYNLIEEFAVEEEISVNNTFKLLLEFAVAKVASDDDIRDEVFLNK